MHQQNYPKNSVINVNRQLKIVEGYAIYRTINSNGTYIALGVWSSGDIILPLTGNEYELKSLTDLTIQYSNEPIPAKSWDRLNWYTVCARQSLITDRLEYLLDYLKANFSKPYSNGDLALNFPLVQCDIADILGTTRVTITRLLQELEKRGKIKRHGRQLLFP